jgi:hypothetical protein
MAPHLLTSKAERPLYVLRLRKQLSLHDVHESFGIEITHHPRDPFREDVSAGIIHGLLAHPQVPGKGPGVGLIYVRTALKCPRS